MAFLKSCYTTSETHCEPHWTNSTGAVELGAEANVWCPEDQRWFDKDAGRLQRTLTVVCRKDQDEKFFYDEVISYIIRR